MAHNCKNWDPVYCTSLLIYCIFSLINEYLLGHVMYYYSQTNLEGNIFTKLKTWILLFCMLMFLCEFLKNFFNLPSMINLGLLYIEQISTFAIYTLVCHFFLKAAASLVGKKRVKIWRKNMNIFSGIIFSFWIAMACYYIFNWITNSGTDVYPCHRPEFMI